MIERDDLKKRHLNWILATSGTIVTGILVAILQLVIEYKSGRFIKQEHAAQPQANSSPTTVPNDPSIQPAKSAIIRPKPSRRLSPKDCVFDISDGTISGISPKLSNKNIMELLPFYTGSTTEGGIANYGGGVFFINHNFFYYTGANTLELRFPCEIEIIDDLFRKDLAYFTTILGPPTRKSEPPFDDNGTCYVFNTDYGKLCIIFSNSKISTIRAMHK